jgi:hypothetical protein
MPTVVGLIGGSGLLKTSLPALQNLTEELVDTAHGRVFLRTGSLADGSTLVFVQRHDARPSRSYTQPADINYAAVALALKAKVRAARSARARNPFHARPPANTATPVAHPPTPPRAPHTRGANSSSRFAPSAG